jgi:hypothetical protein
MPDPEEPQNPVADPVVLSTPQGRKTFSPSPDDAHPLPKRRTEDTKSYAGEWTVMLLAILGWATTFCVDAAQNETYQQLIQPRFMMLHIAQLFSVTVSVLAAKRIR